MNPPPTTKSNSLGEATKKEGSSKNASSPTTKRVIDETLLPPEEASKLQKRRAYNRDCATRARKRTKQLVASLQEEVKELQQDKAELRRLSAVMKAQLEMMEKQNRALVLNQSLAGHGQPSAFANADQFPMGVGLGGLSQATLLRYRRLAGASGRGQSFANENDIAAASALQSFSPSELGRFS